MFLKQLNMVLLNVKPVIYFGVFLSYLITVCSGQTGQDAVQLHATLFDPERYNRRVRPVKDQRHPVQVFREFFVFPLFYRDMPFSLVFV